ncbi:MAG: hypothetical protein IKL46_08345 [Clostridia bacterium]|nr:hypothetical protein [Clostridia bacterium]
MFKFLLNLFKKSNIGRLNQPSETEYVTLTPDDRIANGSEYLNALNWAIDGKKATNIALSGPYGSGKSSVIETFLKNNPSARKRSIKISMATFAEETKNDVGNFEKQLIELDKEEIEKGILKQLFYKVSHKKIPQSRYRKLHRISFWSIFAFVLFFSLIFTILLYVFWPSSFSLLINKIVVAGATVKFSKQVSLICAFLFAIGCLCGISTIYRLISSRFKVKEIKLPQEVSLQGSADDKDTVFNKNMDEIVYFFEETNYRIVFFEDLDRLNTTSIFVHLRELNMILNNYDAIKEPIVFVYAVKDDVFTDVDRTKFFDFIIPIVPIVNSTNSGDILLEKLNKSKQLKKQHNISESFIMDVSPFIADMRILQNIYNEFVVYKATLTTGQSLKLLDEPMLALIIFKNLYPRDFAELQKETGVVKQAFKDKESFISKKRQELQDRVNASSKILESIKTEAFSTVKSLKYAFLCEITNDMGIACSFTPSGKRTVDASSFLKNDYVIPDWSNINDCSGAYIRWNSSGTYQFNSSKFGNAYEKLINKYKTVSLIEDNKIDEEKIFIQETKRNIYNFSSKTLENLLNEYGVDAVLSQNVINNELLVFLLRRGYINEKYVDYINYFKGTSITTEDMNFILGIKNLSPKKYDYKLTRTELVIERLQPYEFEQEVIYNFDLLECLLSSNEYDEKLNLFIKQLSNGNDASWEFIDEFIDITKHKQGFIKILAKQWNKMWDSIFDNSVLTVERKFYYLSLLISYASIESIKCMDLNGNLTTFFVRNSDVLQRLNSIDDKKVIDTISSLNVKFTDIQIENVSTSVLDYIFDNNCYIINFEMIQHIVEYKNKKLVSQLKEKNYSTLIKLNYSPLLKYIEDNIGVYTDEIILLPSNTEEEFDSIIKLLELNVDSKCRYVQIIGNENFYVEDITAVCLNLFKENKEYVKSIWDTIITNGKLKPTWYNFERYWNYCGHTSVSIAYMCKNLDILVKDDSSCIDDYSFIKELITSDIDCESLSKLLCKLPWDEFDIELNTLDKDKVSIMVSQKYFKFDIERYNELSEDFPDLCVDFIIHNQYEYMAINEQIDMNSDLLENLVFDERFARSMAQKIMEKYCAKHMTVKIAKNLSSLNIDVGVEVFNAAWELLDTKQKERLMLENLNILDADKFEKCFSELDDPYNEFSKRGYRHEVYLDNTNENLLLAKRLQEVSYITSYEYKNRTKGDSNKKAIEVRVICCRVKAMF